MWSGRRQEVIQLPTTLVLFTPKIEKSRQWAFPLLIQILYAFMRPFDCVFEHNIFLAEYYHFYLPQHFNCKQSKFLESDLRGLRYNYTHEMESVFKFNFQEPIYEQEVDRLVKHCDISEKIDGLKDHNKLSGKLSYVRKRDEFIHNRAKMEIFKHFKSVDLMQLNQLFDKLSTNEQYSCFVKFTNHYNKSEPAKNVYFQYFGNNKVLEELAKSREFIGNSYFWTGEFGELLLFHFDKYSPDGSPVVKGIFDYNEQLEKIKQQHYWKFLNQALCRGGIRNFFV